MLNLYWSKDDIYDCLYLDKIVKTKIKLNISDYDKNNFNNLIQHKRINDFVSILLYNFVEINNKYGNEYCIKIIKNYIKCKIDICNDYNENELFLISYLYYKIKDYNSMINFIEKCIKFNSINKGLYYHIIGMYQFKITKDYEKMKKYHTLAIGNDYLLSNLFMAHYSKYILNDNEEERKYHIKIFNMKNLMIRKRLDDDIENELYDLYEGENLDIIIESLYFLMSYYYKNIKHNYSEINLLLLEIIQLYDINYLEYNYEYEFKCIKWFNKNIGLNFKDIYIDVLNKIIELYEKNESNKYLINIYKYRINNIK